MFELMFFLTLQQAIEETRNRNTELATKYFNFVSEQYKNDPDYLFYRAVNSFHRMDRKATLQYIDKLENLGDLRVLPMRHKVVAGLMRAEARNWKTGDLGEISRLMVQSKDRLHNKNLNKKTRKIQEEIVRKLDKKIKDLEDELRKRDQERIAITEPYIPILPQEESEIGLEGGLGTVKKLRELFNPEKWGALPARERQRVLNANLPQNLSPRHREAIERYLREINRVMRRR